MKSEEAIETQPEASAEDRQVRSRWGQCVSVSNKHINI